MSKVNSDELTCQICTAEYFVWFAPNDIWNKVMREPDGSDRWPFVCPSCFITEAERVGVKTKAWVITTKEDYQNTQKLGKTNSHTQNNDINSDELEKALNIRTDEHGVSHLVLDGKDIKMSVLMVLALNERVQALINKRVREARIDEVKRAKRIWEFREHPYIKDRINQLKEEQS